MLLHLLEITYAAEDRETVEEWLVHTQLEGEIISVEQYDDEILAVQANVQPSRELLMHVRQQPGITSCCIKKRAVHRIETTTTPTHVLCSFPFREGEEWYLGSGNVAYLCVQAYNFTPKQTAWLTANTAIVAWSDLFDLTSFFAEQEIESGSGGVCHVETSSL